MSHPGLKKFAANSATTNFDDLLRSGKPIWVVNNSEPRSMLIITVNDPLSGKPHNLQFPRTSIPFLLTDMVPREVLERSMQLRTFLLRGVLKVISEEEALKILSSSFGQQEYQRLMTSEFATGAVKSTAAKEMMQSAELGKQTLAGSGVENPDIDYSQVNLHPKVKGWEARVLSGELDGPNLMSDVMIHESEFSKTDLDFMLTGQFPKEVKEFASKKLADGEYKQATVTVGSQSQTLKTSEYEADYE